MSRTEEGADASASVPGDTLDATAGESLATTVLALARKRGVTLATAESCTGGMVASALTGVPGASAVFSGGVVAYSDEVKIATLGVDPGLLATHGAVSAATATAMAEGVRSRLAADIAIAITGIAGPGGGSLAKPVGTVWFAVASAGGASTVHRVFSGDRRLIRSGATAVALELLRRALDTGAADNARG